MSLPILVSLSIALCSLSFDASANALPADSLTVQISGERPAIDDCTVPQNLRVGAGTSISKPLIWNSVAGSMIRYRVRWRQAGSPDWTERAIAPNPFDNITGLTNATGYETQVQTMCNGQPTAYSTSISFTTACNQPDGGYAYAIDRTTALVAWGDFGDGSTYQIRWRTAGATNWPNTVSLSGDRYKFTGLTPTTIYEYQLRTICADGNTSDYSAVRAFITTDCNQPVFLSEIDPVESRIRLAWLVNYDQQVDLRWRVVGSTIWTLVTNLPTGSPTQGNGQSSGFYSLTGLTSGTTYEWEVQTICGPNSRSSFTPTRTFTAACAAPGYLDVLQVLPTSAQVYWRAVDGITYRMQWRPKAVADTTWRTLPDRVMSGNGLMVARVDDLLPGSIYEWRVMTRCPGGTNSAFTSPRTFQTACGPPINVGQIFVTSTSARVHWDALSPTTRYRVRWRRNPSMVWTESNITDKVYLDITGLQTASQYIFQVQAICDGLTGTYSADASFLTYCNIPTRLTPGAVTPTSAIVGWGAYDGVTSYEVQWRPLGTGSWPQSATVTAAGSYKITVLKPNTSYEWRLRTLCTDGNISDYTTAQEFKTSPNTVMFTLAPGDWTNPAVWSDQRIPSGTDSVDLRHAVTVPDGYTGAVWSLQYTTGGRLILGSQAKLNVGM